MTAAAAPADRPGRPPVTSAAELERVALELFATRGFTATTVDDIAVAAGVARRTFFRYYASKKDVVWGDFDTGLRRMAQALAQIGPDVPLRDALRTAVVDFNALPAGAVAAHRQRMALILHVPELQAHSTLRYAAWRGVVADYAAGRLAVPVHSLLPQLVAQVALAVSVAAYEEWLRTSGTELASLLHAAFSCVDFPTLPPARSAPSVRSRPSPRRGPGARPA